MVLELIHDSSYMIIWAYNGYVDDPIVVHSVTDLEYLIRLRAAIENLLTNLSRSFKVKYAFKT